ncbi:MAG: RsmB/NOP family class I SAM-dependent RNA methyltransferase [Burkholderiaceae bacterium]|nr:RsmB/NOP family class I SAM-dependent RNA methyltransferase [Burkholderiaceae bacterium]
MATASRPVKNARRPDGRRPSGKGRTSTDRRSVGSGRLWALEQLLDELLGFSAPADTVVSRFFKAHPQMGGRDRHFYAEAAWAVLRNLSWYRHLSANGPGRPHRLLALLGAREVLSPEFLEAECDAAEKTWIDEGQDPPLLTADAFLKESLPQWIVAALVSQLGAAEALTCARALRQPAPLDLRVNRLLTTPEAAIAALAQDAIRAVPLEITQQSLRVEGKPALQRSQAFRDGWVEVQDLGSQLIAMLVAPRRGEFIVDFCAGAGGKTLALGSAMNNTGRLYALDTSTARLSRFKPRLARSGLSNVWPIGISGLNDDRIKRLSGKAHAVLVDAPCSGLGTTRRNPDLKWRITQEKIPALGEQQLEILRAAAALVRPGGRLVYATCSLLDEENRQVVDQFLSVRPDFSRLPMADCLAAQRIDLPPSWQPCTEAGDLMLWPHRSGTDGFYAACMVRAGDPAEGVG